MYAVKDKVTVVGIGVGWIGKACVDERGVPLYRVLLRDAGITPDGWFLARECELRKGWAEMKVCE